ncbi:MAG: metallophosphatase family protein [Acidobacteriota bacterium]|nr:metallophosphatase family protein [Acidobacteriota bacterium]
MRILIISDIHSNVEGLEACLAAAPTHDRIVNLGDIVGYGGSPNEVTDRARKLGTAVVRGNHDKACSGVMGIDTFNPIAGLAALWTKQTLTPENLDWLKNLPQGALEMPDVPGVHLVHGSPLDEDEYIIVVRDAVEPLSTTPAPLTFFGHTHIQGGFAVDGEQWETLRPVYKTRDRVETIELQLKKTAKYLINPGSAGQPRDGDPRAAFVVFDTEAYKISFIRAPYNIQLAQKHITDAKLPERLATRLADGR